MASVACVTDQVTSCALQCLKPALDCVLQSSVRQITYTIQYCDNVGELQNKNPTASRVRAEVAKLNNKGEHFSQTAVVKLREQEDQLIEKAKRVLDEFNRLNEVSGFTCCGFMPNVWKRHRVGRKARKCIQHIEEFREKILAKIIVDEALPDDCSLHHHVERKICKLQSRERVLNDIIDVLRDDSIQSVGVWGPEGSGKTMLMHQVMDTVGKQTNIQRCVLVQVPKYLTGTSVEEDIQIQIMDELCPDILRKTKVFNERARHLTKWFLGDIGTKVVIILDGLWKKINLDAIGIPHDKKKICNVILTASDMDLLVNDMGLSTERLFQVMPLSAEESKQLFLYIVRRSGKAISEEKKSVAQELVTHCGGLPRLIEDQASILTNHRYISAWHDALREIKSKTALQMLEPVKEILSTWSSDENAHKEIRLLFGLCGLFREPSILVEALTIHCRALGIFDQTLTMKETKDRLKRLLHILRVRSLVGGDNNEIKMTELFREVAVLIASKENYLAIRNDGSYKRSEFKKWTVEQLQVCTALSVDGLDILKDHPELEYNNLKMLLLFGSKHRLLKIGDDKLFNRMKELRGLHLKQIDFISSSFPSFVENPGKLQTLCLDGCLLKDVRHIGNLKKLQILKISGSDIIELPKELGNLTDLRLLDLRGCHKLQVIEQGLLTGLKRLEELYLDDSFDKWEVPHYHLGLSRRNASLEELNEMTWLSTLHVYVPNNTVFPENLKLEQLESYRILLGHVRDYPEENVKVRTLRLDLSDSSSILWEEGVKRIMHKSKSLYLKGMMLMPKPSIHQLCLQGFPCLKHLHLQDCESVEYIVESSESITAFPNLEIITLVNLKNLRKICNGPLMDESFGQLNAVIVEKCHALENVFEFSLMERISALQKIEVKDCKKIKEIVTDDIGHNKGDRKKFKWDKLHHLSLENLEQIVAFCITDTTQEQYSEGTSPGTMSAPTAFFDGKQISFPGLTSLSLIKLPKVRKIWPQNISLAELSKLQSLTVEGIESLTVEGIEEASQLKDILFYSPITTPQKKSSLEKLVSGFGCPKVQVDDDAMIQSPQVLGNSRCQYLCCLIVCGCDTLKFLFTTVMAQALPHLTKLTIAKCKKMEEVIRVDNEDTGLKSIEFQQLTTLCLESLENLTTFSKVNISVSFLSLKSLKISDCLKLAALFIDSKDGGTEEDISGSLFHAKISPSFPFLENLYICNMNELRRIWQCHAEPSQNVSESGRRLSGVSNSKLWETFLNIKKLHIANCSSLEKILDVQGQTISNDNCLDAQLNEVYLEDLVNIENIWRTNDPQGRKIRYRYLQAVVLCNCRRIDSLFPASMTNDLLQLQSLEVKSCVGIKHLIGNEDSSSENDAPQFYFPDVKILVLWDLQKLRSFYCGPHCSEWPSLEQLSVSECNKCKIFGSEYKKSQTSNQASLDSQPLFSVNKNSFCRLSTLELNQNELMKQIWQGLYPMELFRKLKVLKLISSSKKPFILPIKFLSKSPHLETLQVHGINLLKTPKPKGPLLRPIEQLVTERSLCEMELNMIPEMIDLKEALDSLLGASSYSFRRLTSLEVSNCCRLAHLFTYSTVESLDCLTKLTVANCESMKVVVAREEGKAEGEVTIDKLEVLKLDSLPGLTSFCEENYGFRFPSLEEVTVRDCSKMMRFTQGETISPNLTKMVLKEKQIDLHDERNLNKIITENKA